MAETSGLLNRRTGYSRTEGSNPSVSASPVLQRSQGIRKNRSSDHLPPPIAIRGSISPTMQVLSTDTVGTDPVTNWHAPAYDYLVS